MVILSDKKESVQVLLQQSISYCTDISDSPHPKHPFDENILLSNNVCWYSK